MNWKGEFYSTCYNMLVPWETFLFTGGSIQIYIYGKQKRKQRQQKFISHEFGIQKAALFSVLFFLPLPCPIPPPLSILFNIYSVHSIHYKYFRFDSLLKSYWLPYKNILLYLCKTGSSLCQQIVSIPMEKYYL